MSYRIETIAGQTFVTFPSEDGRKRTLTPLAAISKARANIQAFKSERAAIEAEASGIVAAMRKSLAEGTDTTPHRTRMAELKRLDADLKSSIDTANDQITSIRAAATKAEAESIAQAAQAHIAATLQPLDIGELA